MPDESEWRAAGEKAFGYLLRQLREPTRITYGDGRGAIGARRVDVGVCIAFFSDNGYDEPQVMGARIPDSPDPQRHTTADVIVSFSNRESLESLQIIIDRARKLFDAIDGPEAAA